MDTRLLLCLHVLMQHATAVQFILMSEMENSRATLNPMEGLQLARRKFVIICDIHGGKWSTRDTDVPWSDPALSCLPSHIGVVMDVMWIYKQTRVDGSWGANQAVVLLWLHVRRQELLSPMVLTYSYRFHFLESGQVWKMVTSSHHLHIMKAKLNEQTQLHAMISKICRCGISPLKCIFFSFSEVWVKTEMLWLD